MWHYRPPIFPFGQLAYIIIMLAIIGAAFAFFPRKKRVLMIVTFIVAEWQGGLWMPYISMDFRVFHITLLTLLLWNLSGGTFKLRRWKPFIKPMTPWLLLTVWSVFAVAGALNAELARQGPARFLMGAVFFVTILTMVKTPKDFRFLIICIAWTIIGQAIFALLQFKFSGLTFGVIDDVRTHMWWRSRGTFRHPNNLGMTFIILLPIVIRGTISALVSRDKKLLQLCAAATCLGGVALLTTYNRGSWIGLGLGLFIMVSLDLMSKGGKTKKYARTLLGVGVIALLIGSIKFGGFIVNRMLKDDQQSIVEGRHDLQAEGIEVARQHPVFGVGYANEQFYSDVTFVHNLYVLIASETGLPGLLFYLWFMGEFLRMVIRGCRSRIDFVKNYSRGFVSSIVGMAVASIPGPDFWISYGVQNYLWVAIAVMASLRYLERNALIQMKKQKMEMMRRPVTAGVKAIGRLPTGINSNGQNQKSY